MTTIETVRQQHTRPRPGLPWRPKQVKAPTKVSDYAGWQQVCQREADKHCRRARNFAGLRGILIILSAILAAVAAVTSATGVPAWITTSSAGLAAALGVVTTGFGPERKNDEHRHLAANFSRAAREFAFAEEQKVPPARWTVELTTIVGELRSSTFDDSPARWEAAHVPAPATTVTSQAFPSDSSLVMATGTDVTVASWWAE